MAGVQVFSVCDRPDLVGRLGEVGNDWPAFLLEDPVAKRGYGSVMDLFPDLQLAAMEDDRVVARMHVVPIAWAGAAALPDRGWDWAVESAVDHPTRDRSAVSLIEARVDPAQRGRGLSTQLLAAARSVFAGPGHQRPCWPGPAYRQSA